MNSEEYNLDEELSVGDEIDFTWSFREDDIYTFAELVGDGNPLHTDEDFAEDTMFGEKIAHGVLGLGVISAALARLPGTVIYRSLEVSFEGPVKPNDTLEAVAEVVENPKGKEFVVEVTLIANGDEVITGTSTIIST